jgi:hypothetical protein
MKGRGQKWQRRGCSSSEPQIQLKLLRFLLHYKKYKNNLGLVHSWNGDCMHIITIYGLGQTPFIISSPYLCHAYIGIHRGWILESGLEASREPV